MGTKTKIAGIMMIVMALSVPRVWADTGDVKPDLHHGQHEHMMAKILNLSEDQEKQLKDIKQKQKDAKKSIFEQVKSNREAFEAEIVKATPDTAKINDIQTQLKSIQSQMVDNHLNSLLEIKKIMTPEQFAGYMALEKAEDLMKHEGHKGGFNDQLGVSGMRTKEGKDHKDWGAKEDKGDKDHSPEDKD
jgi:Spy/CpxP family protein refolding chaperone